MHVTFELLPYTLTLLGAGLVCGLVNTLASSGSAISLPVLLMLGLSPLDANATNRLPVLFGSVMALYIRWTEGIPMSAGSVAGGHLGARLTMQERAKFWVFRILVAVLLLEIVHLGIEYGSP